MKELENDFIKYWIEDGILYSKFKKQTVMTLENIKMFIALRHQVSNNQKQYWCTDFENLKSFTKEGRDYAEIHGQDFLYATAVVVNSHVTMFLLNTFTKLKKSQIPLKAFKTKEAALVWLNHLKKEKKD